MPLRLVWPGRDGCLLAGELASSLDYAMLGVGLLSVGSSSLPLPKSMLSLEKDVHGGTRLHRSILSMVEQSSWPEWDTVVAPPSLILCHILKVKAVNHIGPPSI
jgi:hypothetical protein